MDGFRKFILRGNVVDLAVGIAIGAAFNSVVQALVKDIITPLAGIVFKQEFSGMEFTIHGSTFAAGDVLNQAISFIILAAIVYFCIVLPMNKLVERMKRYGRPPDPTDKKCPECLSAIPIDANRCAFCTQVQPT